MRLKIPTMPNQQHSKDAPHSYISRWERLSAAVETMIAGGHPREMALVDLCRAIAEGAVRIRALLKVHVRGSTAHGTILEGPDFHIPPEINPADVDLEGSRPRKPWPVRRWSFSIPGSWYLEWIEVCWADVMSIFNVANERDQKTRPASENTSATSASCPAPEIRPMPVGPDPSSTAGSRKPSAGPARRRGPRPKRFERVTNAMKNDILRGRYTLAELDDMPEKSLAADHKVSRDSSKSPQVVVSELNSRQFPTNDK